MITSACEPIAWRFRRRNDHPAPGFTLAELLVAIAIFALLVSIVMGSFNGVFLPTEAMSVQRTHNAMARACLDRMATDLHSIHLDLPPLFTPEDEAETPSPFRFTAGTEADNTRFPVILQFASKAHVADRAPYGEGIAIIRYYLEPGDGENADIFRLRRADTLLFDETLPELGDDPILCENVRTLTIRCINGEGDLQETWDSDDPNQGFGTPRAVAIRLELMAPSGFDVYETTIAIPLWRDEGEVE
jgi:prepilin-type N-terminal cleavage/methylation domain-containing protein